MFSRNSLVAQCCHALTHFSYHYALCPTSHQNASSLPPRASTTYPSASSVFIQLSTYIHTTFLPSK
jgi:hypothetical protein